MNKASSLFVLSLLAACTGLAKDTTTSSQSSSATSSVPSVGTSSTTAPGTTATSDARMCTAIGCDSTLTIDLTEVDITQEATYDVEICVDGACSAETITIDVRHPGTGDIDRGESHRPSGTLAGWMLVWAEGNYIDYHLPEGEYGFSASVIFTLTASDGTVLAQTDEATEVPLERSQPNGPGCAPVCFSGRMTV